MYLGIEIGGTKLQLGVGAGDGSDLAVLERLDVDPRRGAAGILGQIERTAGELIQRFGVRSIGIGFGGPVDSESGRIIKSHQIDGWEDAELAAWCRRNFDLPTVIGNDCDTAALAEAKYGAGWVKGSLFYVTVGTGIGGGFVVGGALHGAGRPAVAEIGHLRPGLHADRPDATVESLASGLGIADAVKARISGEVALRFGASRRGNARRDGHDAGGAVPGTSDMEEEYKLDLLERTGGDVEELTAKIIGQAAAEGNQIAVEAVGHAAQVLGWAIAQMITLLAPEVVVVGGGVSLMGEDLFFAPLREQVAQYVFPPLAESYEIVPAALGELAVVHGAVALAVSALEHD
ncbi:MAG: ROK family protein [Planctomycetes bacterium]|nr:ROK family protein [Planctomycetota bacterium]MBL7039678.1 ROK family protein [Pirellulaceae bacterium]